MPSAAVIRAALIKLMGARGQNVINQADAFHSPPSGQKLQAASDSADALRQSRKDARFAQPSDPLEGPFPTVRQEAHEPFGEFPVARDLRQDPGRLPGAMRNWEVIIEETGAYGQPVFATKTVRAVSKEEALKRVEAEGPFSFQETDLMDGSTITSTADPSGISGDPGFMVHVQPASPPSQRPIGVKDIPF